MSPRPMRIEDAIIYDDPLHMTYMISDKKGHITRRATIEDLISMNVIRKLNGLKEIEWNRRYMDNLAVKKESPRRLTPCPNCGANSWLSGHCEYCGTEEDDG